MLELGRTIGRQHAHDVVYEAAQASASQGKSFPELLASDPRITSHLSGSEIESTSGSDEAHGILGEDRARTG